MSTDNNTPNVKDPLHWELVNDEWSREICGMWGVHPLMTPTAMRVLCAPSADRFADKEQLEAAQRDACLVAKELFTQVQTWAADAVTDQMMDEWEGLMNAVALQAFLIQARLGAAMLAQEKDLGAEATEKLVMATLAEGTMLYLNIISSTDPDGMRFVWVTDPNGNILGVDVRGGGL